ncbi:histone acetyltransferases subunit 3-domain-containing protein [Bombardia bombarda]|uniref:Histone acetyltransferases subunit 3-domain-containing protein n=1 Tax=Bombardia bombarda TaxID=252184 RepID=A0AA39WN49_9PEZI|nr:histone acetyltransferases subunit 3-domain-containing protein [Bombardia bombarda]
MFKALIKELSACLVLKYYRRYGAGHNSRPPPAIRDPRPPSPRPDMPPSSSQKGTGKKGGAAGAMRRDQQQRSRNTTPSAVPAAASLPSIDTVETETLELRFDVFRNLTFEDLVDPAASNTVTPDSKSLDGLLARLQRLGEVIDKRGTCCDRGMRLLAQNRRLRIDEMAAERGREEERRQKEADDEERERKANKKKRKATDSLTAQGSNIGRYTLSLVQFCPFCAPVGLVPVPRQNRRQPSRQALRIRSLAFEWNKVLTYLSSLVPIAQPHNHVQNAASEPCGKPRKLSRDNDSASSSLSPVAPRTPSNMDVDDKTKAEDNDDGDSSSSDDDGRPPPPARPQANTFGEDPSVFPDPTVYEILPVSSGMTEDEIKQIYSVTSYPKSDLADLIAGDPPDKDFSSAKPSNQINFSTFSTYVDPYFRPFTEEDLAFLRERGDRITPFVMPKRGKKHYTEIWAEEDGAMAIDSTPNGGRDKLPPNQARGSIENMDDEVAETDKLSTGPLLTRLLQLLRNEHRAPAAEDRPMTNGINGDADGMNGIAVFDFTSGDNTAPTANGNGVNGLANGGGGNGTPTGAAAPNAGPQALPAATFMPESNSEAWKKASHPKLDYSQVDERIKQELRHIGFLPLLPHDPANPNATPQPDPATVADYDGHFDDEVAARMRLLQARLHEQALVNGARKARLTELVREKMAYQEYQTILEDLDSQVQMAYLKRTRTMGKKPKKARTGGAAGSAAAAAAGGAGGAGAAGMARPGIGDLTKMLMERRRRWIDSIGTVFDGDGLARVPRASEEGSSIFQPAEMAELMRKEKEAWDEEVEVEDE